MVQTKKMIISALCIAIGIVLPMALHVIPNAGQILLPMHFPVLIAGLSLGPLAGLLVGILTPILSSVLTGMPPAHILPSMICELAVYGVVSGMLIKHIHSGKSWLDIYASLLFSMLAGRLIFGIINALIFRAGAYSLEIWLTASFITALPGILLQLLIVPSIVYALRKSKLVA